MINYLNGVFLGIVIFMLVTLTSVNPAVAEKIASIEIIGLDRVSERVLLSAFGLEVGDEINPQKIQKGIKNLYSIGLFSDIAAKTDRLVDGYKLILEVKESPLVENFTFSGLKKIKDKDLRDKIELHTGQAYSKSAEAKSITGMKSIFHEKGYFLAEIETQYDSLPDNKIVVAFKVKEGKKVVVKIIDFIGNNALTSKDLRKKSDMKTKEDRWYRSGDFKQEDFDEDLKKIVTYYRKKGYIDAKVTGHTITYSDDKAYMYINIAVEEGTQYYVGSVNWEGHKLFTRKQLDRALEYDEGDVYNQEKMDKTLESLYGLYTEDGYIYANIIPDRITDSTKVDITYRITENNPAHVYKIDIAGNSRTHEKVIRRELAIRPGDMFQRSALIRSQRNIFNLGFFEDVQLQSNRATEDGDINLTFDVKEKSTGQVSMGAGYSSQDRLTGFLELRQPNMFGRGQTANVRWEFGKTRQNVELSVTEPWFMNTPTTVGLDLFHTSRNLTGEYYTLRRTGGALRLGRPIPGFDFGRAYWQYRLEERNLDFDDVAENVYTKSFLNQAGKRLQSSMTFTITRDSRDNVFHATQGSRTNLRAEFSGAYLGGKVDYQKYEVESAWYFSIWNPFVLMVKMGSGVVAGYSEDATVPIYERYYPGGTSFDGVIRGYKDRDVVPSSDGARSKLIFNIENQFKVVEQIFGLMFFDAGNSWNSIIEARPTDLKRSVGFGIRIETPVGPIGFDYGYGFDKAKPGWEPHFQFGTVF